MESLKLVWNIAGALAVLIAGWFNWHDIFKWPAFIGAISWGDIKNDATWIVGIMVVIWGLYERMVKFLTWRKDKKIKRESELLDNEIKKKRIAEFEDYKETFFN